MKQFQSLDETIRTLQNVCESHPDWLTNKDIQSLLSKLLFELRQACDCPDVRPDFWELDFNPEAPPEK